MVVIAPVNFLDVGYYNQEDWRPLYPNLHEHYCRKSHLLFELQRDAIKSQQADWERVTYNLNYTMETRRSRVRGTGGNGCCSDSLNMGNDYGHASPTKPQTGRLILPSPTRKERSITATGLWARLESVGDLWHHRDSERSRCLRRFNSNFGLVADMNTSRLNHRPHRRQL